MMAERERRRRPLLAGVACTIVLAACSGQPEPTPDVEESKPPVRAVATVDRAVATTGDVIRYTVAVDHDPAYAIDFPEPGAEIAGFRIIDVGSEEPGAEAGRVVVKRWYDLRADLVGSYVLPPVRVSFWPVAGEGGAALEKPEEPAWVEASEIFVEVESVLPEGGEATDIRDIKPLRHPPSRIPWGWILGGAIAVGVAVLAVVLWRRRARVVPPPRPAHEIAFAALDALRQLDFNDPAAVRLFYFSISQVVRQYVEGRWDFNATDLTSEEIVAGIDRVSGLDSAQESALQRFLFDTDQVKFAKHVPGEQEVMDTYECALTFVEATRPVESQAREAAAS